MGHTAETRQGIPRGTSWATARLSTGLRVTGQWLLGMLRTMVALDPEVEARRSAALQLAYRSGVIGRF